MPTIPTSNPELTGLKGIHLWHGGLSSCSQRVRITLAVNLRKVKRGKAEDPILHKDDIVLVPAAFF